MSEVSVSNASAEEFWNDDMRFVVTLSEPAIEEVTFDYRTVLIGSADDNDLSYPAAHTNNNGTITIAPGETSAEILITPSSDSDDERDEAIVLELSNLSDNAFFEGNGLVLRAFGIQRDDDGPGSNLSLFVSDPLITETDSGTTEALFEVFLSRPATTEFAVSYETRDVSAVAGEDYEAVSGTLTFLPGQSSATVSVPVIGDTAVEPSEMFSLVVEAPDTPAVGEAGLAGTAVIMDDDAGSGPVVTLEGGESAEFWNNSVVFSVVLSEPPVDAVTLNYRTLTGQTATSDDLYYEPTASNNNGTVTLAPGQTRADILVQLGADSLDEKDQAFTVELYGLSDNAAFAGGEAVLRATGVILDEDGVGPNLALFVSDAVLTEGDGSGKQALFEIKLSRPATEEFTVTYATEDITGTAGADYVAKTGSLTFSPGQDRAAVAVDILGDTDIEPAETFALNLATPGSVSIGQAGVSGTATLIDDDSAGLPVITFSGTDHTEEHWSKSMRFVVSLSETSLEPVTVDYATILGGSAISDDLYYDPAHSENNGTLTFAPGETTKSVFVRVASDTEDERDESVFLTLRDPEGGVLAGGAGSLSAVAFIHDDDGAGLNIALSGPPVDVPEPESGFKTVEIPVFLSQAPDEAITFDVLVNGGSASAGADFQLLESEITFAPGQVEAGVSLRVEADSLDEGAETILLNYAARPGSDFAGVIRDQTVTLRNTAAAEEPVEGGVVLIGTPDEDTLRGTEFADRIEGLGDDDRLLGYGGDDTIMGGDGADVLNGGDGHDIITGGATAADLRDTIFAGAGDDSVDAGHGNDLVYGQDGNDTIAGGFGVDELQGQNGNDVITGSAFSDLVFGGDGSDFVNGGFGHDRINGGADGDKFYHLGVFDHGSDWVQDYTSAEGDVLVFGQAGASADDFQVNLAHTANSEGERSGDDAVQEAFVIYKPSGQIIWALVDGGGEAEINLEIAGTDGVFDLLA